MKWEIFGFKKEKKLFENLIKEEKLSNSYIFQGISMIGKFKFATELADLLTESTELGIKPDILTVDNSLLDSNSIRVLDIRNVRRFVSSGAYNGKSKVIIINDAHLMTNEAQNAFLKTLEEPNPSSILILVTEYPELLLGTIKSRCQEIEFHPHSREIFEDFFDKNKLGTFTREQREFLFKFSHGKIGLVIDVIKNKKLTKIKETASELLSFIKAPLHERMMISAKITKDIESKDLQKVVLYWILYMHSKVPDKNSYHVLNELLKLYEGLEHSNLNMQSTMERFAVSV